MDIKKTYWNNSENTMTLAFPIAKVNKEKRTVSGFASLDNLDKHGDIITAEANKAAFDGFRGNIREMHGPSAVGKMLNFKEDTFFDAESGQKYNGIFVEAYVSKGAQDAWEKCLDGTYTGFSIGGNIVDAKMEKSDDGGENRRIIHKYELHELSLVDSPANPLANIFSIQKMAAGIVTENVFWCNTDEVASTSDTVEKNCVVCGDSMTNIGWVEQADVEKFEAVEKVIDSYFKKDDAPTPAHEATETAAPGNTIDSNSTINTYPDQKDKQKVLFHDGTKIKKSDDISLNEGGNNMAEDTNTEVAEVAAVEAPAEEVSTVEETPEDTTIEKAVELSEVEDTLDFTKMVTDLKTFFGESIKKNYALQTATIGDLQKVINATNDELVKMTSSFEELKKEHVALSEKHEALNKSVTDMYGKIDYVDNQLKGFESATAVKKSTDLSGPAEDFKIQKSIWQGHFLGVQSLTK
jgi:hypothetical protein